jgi:type I restriction enzyme, S subunit
MSAETWPLHTLSGLLKESRIPGHAGDKARKLTVKLYGLGAVPKTDPRPGSASTRYYTRRAGQLVYSKLDFLNGAFAIVPPGLDGWETTLDLPAFDVASNVDVQWLVRFLCRPEFYKSFGHLAKGSRKARRVGPEEFLRTKIPLPPLHQQQKIAAILSSVDEAIGASDAVIAQLHVVKKAMMAELLTKGLPGRHTRSKVTDVGEVPEGWIVAPVGECCLIRNDLRKPISAAERAHMAGPFPYYGPTKAIDHIDEYRIEGTYALIGEDGDHFLKFDRWSMTQLVSGRFNVNNHAHIVAGTEHCSAAWFATYFQHRDLSKRLTRQGANRYKLRKATLEELLIPLPGPEEQGRIATMLASVDERIATEREVVGGLSALNAGLASALLTGDLRVRPDASGEAAA